MLKALLCQQWPACRQPLLCVGILLALLSPAFLHADSASVGSLSAEAILDQTGGEVLFLVNSGVEDDQGNPTSELYTVTLDASDTTANWQLERTLPIEQVDAFACAPGARRCYFFSKYGENSFPNGGLMGIYDRLTGMFRTDRFLMYPNGRRIPGVVQAGHQPGPDGELIVASMDTEEVYRVDVNTGIGYSLGRVFAAGTDTSLDLSGADLTFDANGTWYLWTNNPNGAEAPEGLYEIRVTVDNTLEGLYLGKGIDGADPETHRMTGLSVRGNGTSTLIASNRYDEMHEQDETGADVAFYRSLVDGNPPEHIAGDMHHVYDCAAKAELENRKVQAGDRLTIRLTGVHNRPRGVRVPVTWALVDDYGFSVSEGATKPHLLSWGDRFDFTLHIDVPTTARPGNYRLHLSLEEMRQGTVQVTQEVTVQSNGARPR